MDEPPPTLRGPIRPSQPTRRRVRLALALLAVPFLLGLGLAAALLTRGGGAPPAASSPPATGSALTSP